MPCKDWKKGEREAANKASLEHYHKKVSWLRQYKASKKCSICGEGDWRCLDLHHRDPETKTYAPRQAIAILGWKRLMAEVLLCDVICANCHRKEHAPLKEVAA